jgi:dipeptidyl-peptidase-4
MPTTWTDRYAAVQELADLESLVPNGSVYPRWLAGTPTFWYDRAVPDGTDYVLVDAERGTSRRIVGHRSLVDALSRHLDHPLDHRVTILRDLDFSTGGDVATFRYADLAWEYAVAERRLDRLPRPSRPAWTVSPDGAKAVELRGFDLWLLETDSAHAVAVTTDGEQFNAYGLGPSPMRSVYDKYHLMQAPDGVWSPDSRYFLTIQTDERHVPDLPAAVHVPEHGLRPQIASYRTSTPGDERVTEYRLVLIDASTGTEVEVRHPRLSAPRMMDTPFAAHLSWWSDDGATAYVVDLERGERTAHVVAIDAATGATSVVFSETGDLPLELSVSLYDPALVFPVAGTDELIWYSERSGHGHLYLYDLASGELVRGLTDGPWQVREVLRVDSDRRLVHFLAGGITCDEEDPYLRKPCVVSLDGGPVEVLSDGPGDHRVWRPGEWGLAVLSRRTGSDPARISGFSPDGAYFVETIGDVDTLPATILRTSGGDLVLELESVPDDALPPWWQWPVRVEGLAADGTTVVYGLLFLPHHLEPGGSYPLIDLVYGGPQESLVPKSVFTEYATTTTFLEAAGYAALGAFALVLDGRGTANRERAFRQASYGAIHTTSNLDDHRAVITELARSWPGLDLGRIGITGFSGGGNLAAYAALAHGDFFHVAVAASGNYDIRLFWHAFGERYHGPYDVDRYEQQAVRTYAAGLTGHLLLIHGLMDLGCPPAGLFQLVEALIAENKDFDLVTLPSTGHEITGYGMRRRLDYFVNHLFGAKPPPPVRMADPRSRVMELEAADAAEVAALLAALAARDEG